MGLQVDPPFGLGQVFGPTSPNDSLTGPASGSYGDNWVGAVKEFTDVNPTTGVVRTNRRKICVAVRNKSGVALQAKRLVTFSTAAGKLFSEVSGYANVTNEERVGVVDEYLPATGVADGEVFWLTVEGPTEVACAITGTNIASGDRLAAITAAASTGSITNASTDAAGRVTPSALTAGTANAGNNGIGVIGYATSAGTTTGTGSVLAMVSTRFRG
jgi:hypothetical protein